MDNHKLYLFTYGLLMKGQELHRNILQNVKHIGPGTVEGALVTHPGSGKDYPFLIRDTKLLNTLRNVSGINSHPVKGELYEVDHKAFFTNLDVFEGAVPLDEAVDSPGVRTDYVRLLVDVNVNGYDIRAFTYSSNPMKDYIRKLVKKPKTKIVIPNGDWKGYMKRRPFRSLALDRTCVGTFGMETEFSSYAIDKSTKRRLPLLRQRKKYRIIDEEGVRRSYPNLRKFLSQSLFSTLRKQDLGERVLGMYYENDPVVNNTFIIPHGIAYVDGECFELDGGSSRIRRLLPKNVREDVECEKIRDIKMNNNLPPEHRYFEVAGFPAKVEKGFARAYAIKEMLRRYHLSSALENVRGVIYDDHEIDNLELHVHSTQYNFIVDPVLESGEDLSKARVLVPVDNDKDQERSKYTNDVVQLLGLTYGPLVSYMTSGVPDDLEFKVREGNRVEFRNSVLKGKDQLVAGIATYVAACRAIENKVKAELVDDQQEEGLEDIVSHFDSMDVDGLAKRFPIVVDDVSYLPSLFRHGYKIARDESYQRLLHGSLDANLRVSHSGDVATVTMKDLLSNLFYEDGFNSELRKITTDAEYAMIEDMVVSGEVELKQYKDKKTGSREMLDNAGIGDPGELRKLYDDSNTFMDFYTRLVFVHNGEISYNDTKHKVTISLNQRMEQPDSDLYIGSVPIEVSLQMMDKGIARWKDVDSFEARIDICNYDALKKSISEIENLSRPLWESYYSMK